MVGKNTGKPEQSAGLRVTRRDVIFQHVTEQLHFPFLYESGDGTWYMTYREGPHGPFGGDRVHCALSRDRGLTWEAYPGLRAGTMKLRLFYRRLSDGTLLANRYTSILDAHRRLYIEMLRSGDDGCVWLEEKAPLIDLPAEILGSDREDFDSTPNFWGRCVELDPGHLVQGFYAKHVNASRQAGAKKYVAGVLVSDDMGRSWRFLSYICTDTSLGNEGPNEMDLEILPNGDILSVFRTGGQIHMSRSTDRGMTWSKSEDTGVIGVSPQLMLLENEVLVMAYGTRDVYVRASLDGSGTVWTEPLLLYKGPGTGYTHMQALGSDSFRVVFDESPFADKLGSGGNIVRIEISVG